MFWLYRAERKDYIKAKYEDKKFVETFCSNSQEVLLELEAAIEEHNLYDVLRCFCEATHHSVDLTDPLPSSVSTLPRLFWSRAIPSSCPANMKVIYQILACRNQWKWIFASYSDS